MNIGLSKTQIIEMQAKELHRLKQGISKFVDNNFVGGAKAGREDYSQMVSCKDIWDLRELIRED